MKIRRRIRQFLAHTPPFDTAYRWYLFVFRHALWQKASDDHELFRQFVHMGSLVFDIGANVGDMTRCFLSLGARHVIAIEPSPRCLEYLHKIPGPTTVVPCAAAAKVGTATMHVSTATPALSTLSATWLQIVQRTERFSGSVWDEVISVPTVTIDALIAEYGKPDFIKIDVEGFESEVLDGLSALPCPLSFEFNSEWREGIELCLAKPCLASAKFNFGVGSRMVLPHWVDRDQLLASLRGVAGDIFAAPL
jgi:FkbM family methyltransferase